MHKRVAALIALPAMILIIGGGVLGVHNQHEQQVQLQQRIEQAAENKAAAKQQQALALAAKATREERGGTTLQNPASTTTPTQSTGTPTRVLIPALGIDTKLEKLVQDSRGVLGTPHYADEAGWFSKGVLPGQQGPAVIVGHVDTIQGPAIFANLSKLKPGNQIIVVMSTGKRYTYRMDSSSVVKKALFPSKEVYGPTPDAQLRIITCNLPFDTVSHTYTNNLVIFATLIS